MKTANRKVANSLLAALPGKNYQRLLSGLEPVTLNFGDVLYEAGQKIRHVYFPGNSLVSLLTLVDGRMALEVGMVGREGMVGIPLALGTDVSPVRALVQGAGTALRMKSARFSREIRKSPQLQDEVYRYANALMAQVSQTAACNRFHVVGARLARWLLMTRDRMRSTEFRLTQEFLSHMLGWFGYVIRTRHDVILDDAAAENQFSADPYILHHRVRSVLCLPLINQSNLTGVLYLENNLAARVFTPDRITVLNGTRIAGSDIAREFAALSRPGGS